jgi:predicted nucleic acid-binding protein
MKRYILGTSVAIKWFVPEPHSEKAARLLDRDLELVTPDLTVIELGALLHKKMELGEIGVHDAREILAAFAQMPVRVVPSHEYLELAFEVAEDISLDFYDSIYFAMGMRLGCPVLTADLKLFQEMEKGPYSGSIVWVGDVG